MSKSSDFRGNKTILMQLVRAFAHRSNETFWKVFSDHMRSIADELTFEESVEVLDVLDYMNGETLFDSFIKKFFIDKQFRFKDDLDQVLRLARIFVK